MVGKKSRKRKHVEKDCNVASSAKGQKFSSSIPNAPDRPRKHRKKTHQNSHESGITSSTEVVRSRGEVKLTSEKKKHNKRKKKNKKKNIREKESTNSSCGQKSPALSPSGDESEGHTSHHRSLPSRLKQERGSAASTPLPPEWSGVGSKSSRSNILTPDDGSAFVSCLKECYRGLSWEGPDALPPSLHSSFSKAFDELNDAGLFLYDVVQPGGKRLTLTSVTRTLIGAPGSTYRYLGLRLFSHPWCDVDSNGDILLSSELKSIKRGATLTGLGYQCNCAAALLRVGDINDSLVKRSRYILRDEIAPTLPGGLVGSAEYNLTLVNRMEPSSAKRDLKIENLYGMGKTSVSWHKDSGLQDFSSIAVYHSLRDYDCKDAKIPAARRVEPWRVAVRVASDKVKTPALSIPLPSGTLYYLLDDFNHQHEHAVLAGSEQLRYSSTHRVAREGQGTWQYIRSKCASILSTTSPLTDAAISNCTTTAKRRQLVKECRTQQKLMTEIEFEWLRQWHVQGRTHAALHPYWHKPIKKLISSYKELECRSMLLVCLLGKSASGLAVPAASEDLFDVLIEAVEERRKLRLQWHERLRDPLFTAIEPGMRPMDCFILDRNTTDAASNELPHDLDKLIADLRTWRASFLQGGSTESAAQMGGKKRSSNMGALTKKEQKRVASNWERVKAAMAKKGPGQRK